MDSSIGNTRTTLNTAERSLRELVCFVVLTLGVTAAFHLSLPLFALRFSLSPAEPALYLYLAGLAMPSAVAVLLSGRGRRCTFCRSVLSPRGSLVGYAAALSTQAAVVLLAWLLLFASGDSAEPSLLLEPGFPLLAAGQIWVVLGEEPGWRGFALPRLESLVSPRQATLALALIWGAWHVPMFFVAGSLQADVSPWLFASSMFAWSAVHTALYHTSRPGVVPNILFHGAANLTLNVGLVPVELDSYLIVAYVLVALIVWGTLSRRGTPTPESG